MLLLDEPELCLHPTAVRAACETLYSLAEEKSGWQIIVTTHAPAFVDLTRDHTTLVRLERDPHGIGAITLYCAARAGFDADERQLLKLLNTYDPYMAEFFFGGRTVVVEGDTEYSAFRHIIEHRSDLRDVHVVRARGKALIVLLVKILNQFKASYGVLHDFDFPLIRKGKKKGQKNGMWTENEKIRAEVEKGGGKHRLIGAMENFEQAIFGEEHEEDKPYDAVRKLTPSSDAFARVEQLLRVLCELDSTSVLPSNFAAYVTQADLAKIETKLEEQEAKRAADAAAA